MEFRRARRIHAGGDDRHRHHARDAVHAAHHVRLRFRRAHHARRELRLAAALHPHERRVDVLHRRVHPHLPRPLLRIVQVAARDLVVAGHHHSAADDGDRVHGLRAALGPDELLGCDRHHQPVFGAAAGRQEHRDLAVGRLRGRQPDPQPLLLSALPAALRDRGRGRGAYLGAAHPRLEQSARYRHQGPAGQGPVPPVLHGQGSVRHRRVPCLLFGVRVLRAQLLWRAGQLHPRQPAGDAAAYRARMVLPAVLRNLARHHLRHRHSVHQREDHRSQAGRRDRHVRRHRAAVPAALARHQPRALGALPPGLQEGVLGVPGRPVSGWAIPATTRRKACRSISARSSTFYYFAHFLVVLPLLGWFERPLPLPTSISEPVLGGGRAGAASPAKSMEKA